MSSKPLQETYQVKNINDTRNDSNVIEYLENLNNIGWTHNFFCMMIQLHSISQNVHNILQVSEDMIICSNEWPLKFIWSYCKAVRLYHQRLKRNFPMNLLLLSSSSSNEKSITSTKWRLNSNIRYPIYPLCHGLVAIFCDIVTRINKEDKAQQSTTGNRREVVANYDRPYPESTVFLFDFRILQ